MDSEAVRNHAMNGGDGHHSYKENSSYQGQVVGQIEGLVQKMVAKAVNCHGSYSPGRSFRVADMGSSVGPNTLRTVQMIIEAVEKKYRVERLSDRLPEFHVFFNDRPTNDFNTLFRSLPSEKKYFAAGVPGSFQGRLFPEKFLDFVSCTYALNWLSEIPKTVLDQQSPAFNKDKIHYGTARKEVVDAFTAQFHEDMYKFIDARSREVVPGGMMALTIRARPDGTSHHQLLENRSLNLLGSCILDMVKKGTISEAKVNGFNIPVYFGTPREIEYMVRQDGNFDIEKIDNVTHPRENLADPRTLDLVVGSWRAALEGLLVAQFGQEVTEEIFRSWRESFEDPSILDAVTGMGVVFLLKRKDVN
ncbi:hypothetical protein MLD38_032846 [Melastoma candidum]|uniref:Uncharacterized protein n=1 Tax=Melastoma candidum TaxID=119954 RepID=A0ACB9M745_9MYRT|nr:hypothetical protein MLD38_032846 [Melastoma candidum]